MKNFMGVVLTLSLSVICISSCVEKEQESPLGHGRKISFSVGAQTAQTKSASVDSLTPKTVSISEMRAEDGSVAMMGKDTLFLISEVSEDWLPETPGTVSPSTKAAPLSKGTFYDDFRLFAYSFDNSFSERGQADFMDGITVSKNSTGIYEATTPCPTYPDGCYYWPEGKKLRFIGFAPTSADGLTLSNPTSGSPTIGRPVWSYTVPSDASHQMDLIYTDSGDLTWTSEQSSNVKLSFLHALTAVKIVTGGAFPAGTTITKVKFEGLYGRGTYTLGSSTWTLTGGHTSSYEVQPNTVIAEGTAGSGIAAEKVPMVPEAYTFIMLPQSLSSDAKLTVEYTDAAGAAHSIINSLTSSTPQQQSWPMGHSITYKVSKSQFVPTLEVTGPDDFNYDGTHTYPATNSYLKVKSYSTNAKTGAIKAEPWTAEFVEDDGNGGYRVIDKPAWVTINSLNGWGVTSVSSTEQRSVSVSKQTPVVEDPHNDALRLKPTINTTYTPYNLSNSTGAPTVENTANCYIINNPGTYSLPLVYGNAIKNSLTNEHAYKSNATGEHILKVFLNHLDAPITDPYIYNNTGCTPHDATIVWQDEQELVQSSSVALTSDHHSIQFTIPSGNSFKQGNAIIAVRDASGTIMWSWHIWVTDYIPNLPADKDDPMKDKRITNAYGEQFTIMPVNVGWFDNERSSFPAANVSVRVRQNNGGEQRIFNIIQKSGQEVSWGNTFYQWGRKDPQRPAEIRGISSATDITPRDKQCFYNGTSPFETSKSPVDIGVAIKSPATFYTHDFHNNILAETIFYTSLYTNYWGGDDFSASGGRLNFDKTIYDPCPFGYRVPKYHAFSGIGSAQRSFDSNTLNTPYESFDDYKKNVGWTFYCNKMNNSQKDPSAGTFFLPYVASRYCESGEVYIDHAYYGYRDCLSAHFQTHKIWFMFDGCYIYETYNTAAYGEAIRPVLED